VRVPSAGIPARADLRAQIGRGAEIDGDGVGASAGGTGGIADGALVARGQGESDEGSRVVAAARPCRKGRVFVDEDGPGRGVEGLADEGRLALGEAEGCGLMPALFEKVGVGRHLGRIGAEGEQAGARVGGVGATAADVEVSLGRSQAAFFRRSDAERAARTASGSIAPRGTCSWAVRRAPCFWADGGRGRT
jgi:hypothetical protein